ncbi:MAG TPA: hypothetical protein VGV59_05825 [Pyrinomonadaceae bacterium]|nr:hypothetical protein [Pyrinomonadaceae bacterium]
MNSGTYRTRSWLAVLVLVVTVAAYNGKAGLRTDEAANVPQDVMRIESRLSQLENRFYSIESSVRALEQQTRVAGVTRGTASNEAEVSLLRAEVEALRRRLAEMECGLARVDERTLSQSAKEARRRSAGGVGGDPCRLNAEAPLRLNGRP